jgi:membrane protease YdiL (CAAX protease family)
MAFSVFFIDGKLRAIWRSLVSLFAALFLSQVIVGIVLGVIWHALGWRPKLFPLLAASALLALPLLLALYKFFTAVFEGRPLGSVGLAFHRRWLAELIQGLILGAVMMLVVAGLDRVLGLAHFAWIAAPLPQVAVSGVFLGVVLLAAAADEELTFRGYPFQRLVEAVGPAGAVAVFSLLFGIIHLLNQSSSWISTLNTTLIGISLAVAYLRTRALWLPFGIHFSWNFVQGYLLGLPVSGILFPSSLLRPEVHGSTLLTGGAYGPEASVLTSGVIASATVYLLYSKRIYTTQEMWELVLGPSPFPTHPAGREGSPSGTRESSETSAPRSG